MIGRDVEDDGSDCWDGSAQCFRGWKLDTSRTDQRAVGAFFNERDDGDADVSANQGGQPCLLENLAYQCRRGGLSIGAGDGKHLSFEETRSQLQLADDGAAKAAGLGELRRIERHAGTDNDEILTAEGEQAVAAGLDHNSFFQAVPGMSLASPPTATRRENARRKR